MIGAAPSHPGKSWQAHTLALSWHYLGITLALSWQLETIVATSGKDAGSMIGALILKTSSQGCRLNDWSCTIPSWQILASSHLGIILALSWHYLDTILALSWQLETTLATSGKDAGSMIGALILKTS